MVTQTVADGCTHRHSIWRTQPCPQPPKVKPEPSLRIRKKNICTSWICYVNIYDLNLTWVGLSAAVFICSGGRSKVFAMRTTRRFAPRIGGTGGSEVFYTRIVITICRWLYVNLFDYDDDDDDDDDATLETLLMVISLGMDSWIRTFPLADVRFLWLPPG